MRIGFELKLFLIFILLFRSVAFSQIPVEIFAGHEKATMDIMFFKYFKNKAGNNSRFLFFNRNRASVDYRMTSTSYLPRFGFTEAVSYNHEKWEGLAPVLVCQIFSSGIYSKAGFQFAYLKKDITMFSWLVCETKKDPFIDLFFLGRYAPGLKGRLKFFSQLELLNSFPTVSQEYFSFTQRIRLGLKCREFQFGVAADFTAVGRTNFSVNDNIGVFLRYEL